MKPINMFEAKTLIEETNGKLFSVQFRKKDGTDRHMVCRLGVKKHLTGKGLSYDPAHYNLLPVYDVHKSGYRMINLKTISALQIDKIVYVVNNAA